MTVATQWRPLINIAFQERCFGIARISSSNNTKISMKACKFIVISRRCIVATLTFCAISSLGLLLRNYEYVRRLVRDSSCWPIKRCIINVVCYFLDCASHNRDLGRSSKQPPSFFTTTLLWGSLAASRNSAITAMLHPPFPRSSTLQPFIIFCVTCVTLGWRLFWGNQKLYLNERGTEP